ncbi:Cation/H+ exchanger [Macleaya cordata]|uniref:Cation/H+ exchanger n=1 Tax=Macleaya cordata TaxID=56857 RepID=A0A200QQF9_MACCD|nr:Cation/H+ exchanger [Macleaya cordata]
MLRSTELISLSTVTPWGGECPTAFGQPLVTVLQSSSSSFLFVISPPPVRISLRPLNSCALPNTQHLHLDTWVWRGVVKVRRRDRDEYIRGVMLFAGPKEIGIFFGPSVLGRNKDVKSFLFPRKGDLTLDTLALFSSMFFLFKVGVKIDPTIIKRVGKKSYAIGFSCFVSSFASGICSIILLTKSTSPWREHPEDQAFFTEEAPKLIVVSSISSFPVIACALSDLNILNSDLGRLATSSSMVTDICHLCLRIVDLISRLHKDQKSGKAMYAVLAVLAYLMFVAFVVRRAALWVVKRTPEGEAVKEIYITCIFVTVLLCGLASEAIGLNAMMGTLFLGLAIPDGPPLGASIIDKLEYLVSVVFMPVHVAITGMKTDVSQLYLVGEHHGFLWFAEITVIISCYLGKLVGVALPSLYFGLPIRDAFLLGLIMNIKGIVEVAILNVWVDFEHIKISTHTITVFTLLVITAIIIPSVRNLYDPSTRYLAYRRRSILHSRQNLSDFRILVCVHNEDDAVPIIRLLEASNPTRLLPFSIFALHLVELIGRASPLLIAHSPHQNSSANPSKTERIINAFRRFEQRHYGVVSVQAYSTISPYASMHNDICVMSIDKGASLIIFPFHKQGSRNDLTRRATNRSMKTLVQNLLSSAPCSLGILVDCTEHISLTTTISSSSPYRVAMLFLGGPDDREALAFAMNMINHRSVYLTVIRFFSDSDDYRRGNGFNNYSERQKLLDDELVDHFRVKTMDNERAAYKEVEVKDGVETIWVIRSIKDDYDLMMVGRQRQSTYSILTAGLSEDWGECEELGVIGELLTSSDFGCKGSILAAAAMPLFNVTTDDSILINIPIKGKMFLCFDRSRAGFKGIWSGDNPLNFITDTFIMQLTIGSLLTRTLQLLLSPFHQASFVPQVLAGLIVGPSGLSRNEQFKKHVFTLKSVYPQETLGVFGCMLYIFIIGLKMDVGIIMRSERKAWILGITTFITPLLLTIPLSFLLSKCFTLEKSLDSSLLFVAVLESSNSFHVIACLLSDLKLLNSELGHLASSSSMISGLFSTISLGIAFTWRQSYPSGWKATLLITISSIILLLVIVFVLRPMVVWMIRRSPEGKPVKQIYLTSILLMVLGTSFLSELFGQHLLFGPMFLGLAIPDGPPIGAALTETLDWFVSGLMLPLYFLILGGKTDVREIELKTLVMVELLSVVALLGKIIGTIVPALLCRMPFQDAFILALILSSLGFLDLQIYSRAVQLKFINSQCFTIMSVTAMVLTAIISPMLRFLYNPSKRYISYKKRTIQHNKRNTELRVLVCVFNQENVPTLINLLQASNPTIASPIVVYVVHLIELIGRASPIFLNHQSRKKIPSRSELIVNAFRIHQQQNKGLITLQSFTTISPFATVHDDVCTLALSRRTSLIIIPFHIQWDVDGTIQSTNHRNANFNIIDKAPCSVGILIDRGNLSGSVLATSRSFNHICMIYLGGHDDREALAYAARMCEDSNINLTLIRMLPMTMDDDLRNSCLLATKKDDDFIGDFRLNQVGTNRIFYREEKVMDGVGTVRSIRMLEDSYDLILVGRRHETDSPLLRGLTEWNEYPELGSIGDMLASPDFRGRASVLVVQQHVCVTATLPDSPKYQYRVVNPYTPGNMA